MQETTPISFLDFCLTMQGDPQLSYVIVQYVKYQEVVKGNYFADLIESQSFANELDFCFRMRILGIDLRLSRVIYAAHVKKIKP
jgi:hypothetical protein